MEYRKKGKPFYTQRLTSPPVTSKPSWFLLTVPKDALQSVKTGRPFKMLNAHIRGYLVF
jgi:hypothetical protein